MSVYFIQAECGGPIKIGATSHLKERLSSLSRQSSGQKLRVLGTMKGHIPEERQVHRRFSHLRGWGEWFEPADDLLSFIDEHATPWDGKAEAPALPIKIWMDPHVLTACQCVANLRGLTVGEYISEAIRDIAHRESREEIRRDERENQTSAKGQVIGW